MGSSSEQKLKFSGSTVNSGVKSSGAMVARYTGVFSSWPEEVWSN